MSRVAEPDDAVDAVVIGIGQLGLCFALTLERAGLSVIGVDTRSDYVSQIREKTLAVKEPGVSECLRASKRLEATTDIAAAVARSRLIFILVPTPTSGNSEAFYDHGILSTVLVKLNQLKLSNKSIVINSTVIPGYVRTIGKLLLKDCVRTTLSYNPAFVAQGDIMDGYTKGGWFGLVLIGEADTEVGARLEAIYRRIAEVGGDGPLNVCHMSPESAEICKLASNCFRTTKISFCNMIGDIADATAGADKYDICRALGMDASIGAVCMRPGYGYGGPCYPRDNRALGVYAASVGIKATISQATDEYNELHHDRMAAQLVKDDHSSYAFEDVGYKPGIKVPLIDASPKLAVAKRLAKAGKRVVIRDRPDMVIEVMKEFGSLFTYEVLDNEMLPAGSAGPRLEESEERMMFAAGPGSLSGNGVY